MRVSSDLSKAKTSFSKKRTIQTRLNLDKLMEGFVKQHNVLTSLKVEVYKSAWLIEQAYNQEIRVNSKLKERYSDFRSYMLEGVPKFDFLDYYQYKPLIVLDKNGVLLNISNSALTILRKKMVNLTTGAVHKDTLRVIESLPKGKDIDAIHILEALQKADFSKKQVRIVKKRQKNKLTHSELSSMTKKNLITLCLNMQKRF